MEQTALVAQSQAVEVTEGGAFLAMLAQAARDPSVDVAKMQAIMEMCERQRAKVAETAFAEAMKAAQSEMVPILRESENEHTRSRYAKLETIDAKLRPIITKHGFSLTFNSAEPKKAGAVRIVCDVLHQAGHSKHYELEGDLDISGSQGKANKTSIQGLGSSVSYLRRYLTLMIFNVALTNEDNDGNSGATLTDQQASTITDMLNELSLPPERFAKFLDFADAPSVKEIRQADFGRVWQSLKSQLTRRERS